MDEAEQLAPEKIGKLEGAERLLKSAVQLFFDNGEMLAIHALTASAHEVLRTLLQKKGYQESLLKNNPSVRPEKVKELLRNMNQTQNFLKHADQDPDEILEYYKEETPFWIFDAIRMYSKLTGSYKFRAFSIFNFWFLLEYPGVVEKKEIEDKLLAIKNTRNAPRTRDQFRQLINNPRKLPLPNLV